MPEITVKTLEFVRDQFQTYIEDMLDDPSFMLDPDETQTPEDFIKELKVIALDLGVDWEGIIAKAPLYERERILALSQQNWPPCDRSQPSALVGLKR